MTTDQRVSAIIEIAEAHMRAGNAWGDTYEWLSRSILPNLGFGPRKRDDLMNHVSVAISRKLVRDSVTGEYHLSK